MDTKFDARVGDLYKQLNDVVRAYAPEATDDDVNVALSAINSLAVILAVHNGVDRQFFLDAAMYTFDKYTALVTPAHDQEVH
jgi:hypothetical protein